MTKLTNSTIKDFLNLTDEVVVNDRSEEEWLQRMCIGDDITQEELDHIGWEISLLSLKMKYMLLTWLDKEPAKRLRHFICMIGEIGCGAMDRRLFPELTEKGKAALAAEQSEK